MNINLHENGWTGIVEDIDLAKITQKEVNEIGKFLATNTLVVIRNHKHLTVEDEIRVAHMFGNVENLNDVADKDPWKYLILPNSNNEALRVTGELDEHGKSGLFGHVSDLDWHCNKPAVPTRMPLVWLFGERGTAGSKTSWNNNILSYADLDFKFKEKIKNLKMVCGWKRGSYSEFSFEKEEDYNEYYTPNLVHTNQGGMTGLFFPFLQFRNFVGMSIEDSRVLTEQLRDHILQEKYIYHHDWQDGDIVIAEQWLGIHKRWRFEDMPNRVLHRITFDFANIELN